MHAVAVTSGISYKHISVHTCRQSYMKVGKQRERERDKLIMQMRENTKKKTSATRLSEESLKQNKTKSRMKNKRRLV